MATKEDYEHSRRLVFAEVIAQHEDKLRRLHAMPRTPSNLAWIAANEASLEAIRKLTMNGDA